MLKKIIILIIVSITIKAQSELFISEYLEGSGNNKAIEIYNPQNVTVDLSNYRVTRWNNGGTSTSMDTIRLLHQLSPNDVYVIADSAAEQDILSQADTTSTITFFNGDDYLALQKFDGTNWIDIDVFGEATGVDPGDAWPVAGTPSATREHTLIRKSNISYGTTDWAESAGTDSVNSQWLVYPQDTFIFLGAHPGTNSTANPEPSEYPTNFIANAPSTTVTLIWDDALGTQLPDGYLLIGYDISHY
ncbi:MAG: lamin tail domain-containing protein, partial [Melioribacteraceae bacterium]|nr:lamin tail domain-containing protein [Melioribacteraceae bacterium]